MIKVIGVRFRTAGKVYYFDPLSFEIKKGDHVIVETARGIEYGTVVGGIRQVSDDEVIQPLKPVLRVATERDSAQEADNKQREKDAYRICQQKIREHGLDMKLIDAEYTFDNNKVLFYFTADGRIDFRELVKDLAAIFKTRIELRQIGVRDETKLMGGIGMCGRPLCCHAHLSDFMPVSIKMAKEQNLSLNPTKISGVCGRLMCCLNHEEETYEELNRNLPHTGDRVTCPDGTQGEVIGVNVLRQQVKVVVEKGDEKEIHEYKAEEIRFVRKGHRQVKAEVTAEELQALELMEKQDKLEAEAEEKPAKRKEREEGEGRSREERRENGGRRNRERGNREERRENGEERSREERCENGARRNREERHENGEERSREERRENGEERSREERRENSRRRNRGEYRESGEGINREERRENGEGRSREERRENGEGRSREERRENGERRSREERRENGRRRNRGERRENGEGINREESRENGEGRSREERRENREAVNRENGEGGEHRRGYNRNRRRNRPEGAKEQHEA